MPEWLTTAQVAAAGGVTESSAIRWARLGVLPKYTTVYGGARGRQARWPLHAADQARWVKAQLEQGYTFEEIRQKLAAGEFKPQVESTSAIEPAPRPRKRPR